MGATANYPLFTTGTFGAPTDGIQHGASSDLQIVIADTHGHFDSHTFTGFQFDPTSGLSGLFEVLLKLLTSGSTGSIASVLAAVQHTFPTT